MPAFDAIVIGSGPNGLAAAIELSAAGLSTAIYEARETLGGGARTADLTIPGFRHDVCSAVHPLGYSSPVFQRYGLEKQGLEWLHPEVPLAHPFDDGTAATLMRDVDGTGKSLGADASAWRRIFEPLVGHWDSLLRDTLGPPRLPRHPLLLARFGVKALQSADGFCRRHFRGHQACALFSGCAAHVMLPLDRLPTAAFGLVLAASGHSVGWPLPKGGSQSITDALAARFGQLGGHIVTGHPVTHLDELPTTNQILFDLTPRQILRIAGHRLPPDRRRALERYRYGWGVCKVDWALSEPVPWMADACRRAGTVHVGGGFREIAAAENCIRDGRPAEKPFVLVAQPSLFDTSRAPEGRHTLWAYCHMPHGSTIDHSEAIEAQIERFAPGFGDTVLDKKVMTAASMESYNANYIGGDINGGVQDLGQLFTRPIVSLDPYRLAPGMYICSSASPPGGGVHGFCGYRAALSALRRVGLRPVSRG